MIVNSMKVRKSPHSTTPWMNDSLHLPRLHSKYDCIVTATTSHQQVRLLAVALPCYRRYDKVNFNNDFSLGFGNEN